MFVLLCYSSDLQGLHLEAFWSKITRVKSLVSLSNFNTCNSKIKKKLFFKYSHTKNIGKDVITNHHTDWKEEPTKTSEVKWKIFLVNLWEGIKIRKLWVFIALNYLHWGGFSCVKSTGNFFKYIWLYSNAGLQIILLLLFLFGNTECNLFSFTEIDPLRFNMALGKFVSNQWYFVTVFGSSWAWVLKKK